MNHLTKLTAAFSRAAIPLFEVMIEDFDKSHPEECAAVRQAIEQGERLRLSLTANGPEFEIDLDCVNDYGEARKITSIKPTFPERH